MCLFLLRPRRPTVVLRLSRTTMVDMQICADGFCPGNAGAEPAGVSASQCSSNTSQCSSAPLVQLPLVLHITPGDQEQISCKQDAVKDIRRALTKYHQRDSCSGQIRKVTLHSNKVSFFLWVNESVADDAWIAFAKDFAGHKGHVVKLADKQVMSIMQRDEKLKTECEKLASHFSSSNLSAVANLSQIIKESPISRKRSLHGAFLTKALTGANEIAMERIKNKKGKTISKVYEEAEIEDGSDGDEEGTDL